MDRSKYETSNQTDSTKRSKGLYLKTSSTQQTTALLEIWRVDMELGNSCRSRNGRETSRSNA